MRAVFRRYPWLINVVILIFAAYVATDFLARPGAPMEVLSAVPDKTFVALGEPVYVLYDFERRRNCPGTVDGAWSDSTGRETKLPVKPAVITRIGRQKIRVALVAPPRAGLMCYDSTIRYQCEDRDFTVVSPSVCVTVMPPP